MKFLRFFWLVAFYNLKRELEFRLNTLLSLIIYFGWFGLVFISVELIFGQVSSVAGWTRNESFILAGVYLLFLSLTKAIFHSSFHGFTDAVRTGYFDFWLLKPISVQLLISINRIEWDQLIRALAAGVILIKLLARFGVSPSWAQWFQFALIFGCGLFSLYSVTFIISTTIFWFTNLFNLNDMFNELYNLGNRPAQIYQGILEPAFFIVIPVALVATLPAQALLGNLPPKWLLFGPIITLVLMGAARGFWYRAVAFYSSASS